MIDAAGTPGGYAWRERVLHAQFVPESVLDTPSLYQEACSTHPVCTRDRVGYTQFVPGSVLDTPSLYQEACWTAPVCTRKRVGHTQFVPENVLDTPSLYQGSYWTHPVCTRDCCSMIEAAGTPDGYAYHASVSVSAHLDHTSHSRDFLKIRLAGA